MGEAWKQGLEGGGPRHNREPETGLSTALTMGRDGFNREPDDQPASPPPSIIDSIAECYR